MKKIVLMTATGQGNLGDELILSQEIQLLLEHFQTVEIKIFSHDIHATIGFLTSQNIDMSYLHFKEYFPTHIRRYPVRNIFNYFTTLVSIARCDALIIGGGGLLYDPRDEGGGGRSPVRHWRGRVGMAKFFRKQIIYWGIGISTPENVYDLFPPTCIATVRDDQSLLRLQELGISASRVTDPVFLFGPVDRDAHSREKKVVGLALRKKGLDTTQVKNMTKELLSQGYTLVGIPHSIHPDNQSLDDKKFMEGCGLSCASDIQDALRKYREVDIIITNRFHGIVLSTLHGIPVIPIGVNTKIKLLSKSLGIQIVESIGEIDPKKMLQEIDTPHISPLRESAIQDTKQYILDPLCDLS